MVCWINGKRLKYSTRLQIYPKQWNKTKGKLYAGGENCAEVNETLDRLTNIAKEGFYEIANNGKQPSVTKLRNCIDQYYKLNASKSKSFFECYDEFYKEKEMKNVENSVRKFRTTKKHLLTIEKLNRLTIDFDEIDCEFIDNWVNYLLFELRHKNETVKDCDLKCLISFLNWSVKKGYNKNLDFRNYKFPYKTAPTDHIALTEDELEAILNVDLTDRIRLERTRDLFCIESYTGLRYSDISALRKEHIKDNKISLLTRKTATKLFIPVADKALKLLTKYMNNGENKLPKISNQAMNKNIKIIGRLAGISGTEVINVLIGKERNEIVKPRYEMIATHTSRRTFVTLSYKFGMKPLEIMAITGHSNYQTFMKYYKLEALTIDESYLNAWEGRGHNKEIIEVIKKLAKNGVSLEVIADSTDIPISDIKQILNKNK